jgi:hypothetical protein
VESKQEAASDVKAFTKGKDSEFTSECKTKSDNGSNHSGITLKEKDNDPPTDDNKKNAAEASSTSPKRRKVLKTRIDERGREGNTLSHETSQALFCDAYIICLGLLAFAEAKTRNTFRTLVLLATILLHTRYYFARTACYMLITYCKMSKII